MLIHFGGRTLSGADGESVLECLERHGEVVPSLCRSGVCQSCLLRADEGSVPAVAQQGLKAAWKRQGYFLACVCRPAGDLTVARCDVNRAFATRVLEVEWLSATVVRVELERPADFSYASGQFVQLVRPSDQLMRPYSLASLPDTNVLELHVAVRPNGQLSSWLSSSRGQDVVIKGPFGECSYFPEEPERSLLLVGTGTGLAPLLGVVRAALAAGHRAPIRLFHGASRFEELYLWHQLRELQQTHPQLDLVGSASLGMDAVAAPTGPRAVLTSQPLEEIVLSDQRALVDSRIYLCGNPDFVRALRKKIYLAGTPLERIHFDPFVPPAAPPAATLAVA